MFRVERINPTLGRKVFPGNCESCGFGKNERSTFAAIVPRTEVGEVVVVIACIAFCK